MKKRIWQEYNSKHKTWVIKKRNKAGKEKIKKIKQREPNKPFEKIPILDGGVLIG